MIPQPEAAQKTLISFGAFLCIFFCFAVVGRRWVRHPRSNPSTTDTARSLPVCRGKESVLQEEFNSSTTSSVLALSPESHLQGAAGPSVPRSGVLGLLVWRARSAALATGLQFNSATCSSRLKLREELLPPRQGAVWGRANNPSFKPSSQLAFLCLTSREEQGFKTNESTVNEIKSFP